MGDRPTAGPSASDAEQEYKDLQDDEYGDPSNPNTFPSGDTIDADREDARAEHDADRAPTPDEERLADELDVDPQVAGAYDEALERGAHQRGEGRI